ncbi:RNA-binding KH domain-containing protein PEPPER-like [Tasmannia lanceolata]|uniref:RNA-binding KH domain-containing protein PEPPER-like n=1 Tax=Tasmannia lanceolata TaxID=3420 RepID=UPI004063BCB9
MSEAPSREGEARRSLSPYSSVSEEGEEKPEKFKKRHRDSDSDHSDSDHLQPSKRRGGSHDVLFRIVLPSRQIGRVIGKKGIQIQRIREETQATIKIADPIAQHEERVIIISSRDDDSTISNAESALYHIARVILKDGDDGIEASKVGAGHVAANMIRLLIAGSQAGCLIGVSGQNIEKIRNSSGATVTILAQNQLPSCASAHESDRLVQVTGDVPEVLKALEKIGCTLRENPPKKVISIRPTFDVTSSRPYPSYLAIASAEHVTSEMMISEVLVGGLIGKHGSNISQIRNQSGATIKVTGERGETKQRQIYFGGTAQQVAIAKELVERYIYSQLLQPGAD